VAAKAIETRSQSFLWGQHYAYSNRAFQEQTNHRKHNKKRFNLLLLPPLMLQLDFTNSVCIRAAAEDFCSDLLSGCDELNNWGFALPVLYLQKLACSPVLRAASECSRPQVFQK